MTMKIVAGLGALEDFLPLADAGADEVFVGYVPGSWYEKYADFLPLNRREVRYTQMQIDTLGDMHILRRMAEDRGIRVSVTFNAPVYAPEQLPMILDIISDLYALGYDRWIVADPALMCAMKARNAPGVIQLSGEAGAFTAGDAEFFARNFSVGRIIHPRRTSISEMRSVHARFPEVEQEAFALNEKCHFSGAFCMSAHCDAFDALCRVDYRPVGPDMPPQIDREISDSFGAGGCAVCALEALEQAGITHLKVVGRGAHPENIRRDVAALKAALAMSPEERIANFASSCGNNCYYPD